MPVASSYSRSRMDTASLPKARFTVPASVSRSRLRSPESVTEPPVTEALLSTVPEGPTNTILTFVPTVSKKRSLSVFLGLVRLKENIPIFFKKRIYTVPEPSDGTLSPNSALICSEDSRSHFQLEPGILVVSTSQDVSVRDFNSHVPVSFLYMNSASLPTAWSSMPSRMGAL